MANAGKAANKANTGRKSTSKKPAAGAKKTAGKTSSVQVFDSASLQKVDPDYRRRMIAETSYYIAERHGFINNSPVDNWLEAEVLVDRLIESGEAKHGASVLSPK